jgi:membrane associated rhomboid family serine protease
MGIYDRDYYRRDGPGFFGPLAGPGLVCKWLVLINVVVFILQIMTMTRPGQMLDDDVVHPGLTWGPLSEALVLNYSSVLHGEVWRLVTYAFLHDPANLWHVVFNMLFLVWFGIDVENIYGTKEFLLFYLFSAFVGGVCFMIAHAAGVPGTRCLGASGAVTAVMVLCAMHYPNKVILLFFILPIPIWIFILFQLVPDAYGLLMALKQPEAAGDTAFAVHLGGAGFAYLYYKRHWRLLDFGPDLKAWKRKVTGPRLRVYREEQVAAPAPLHGGTAVGPEIDEHMEASLDRVLEKVARSGYDSLTASEQQLLMRASEVYKRRRS